MATGNYFIKSQRMKPGYFGAMGEYVEASYAPTDRAKCKSCKSQIEKDKLRMGIIQTDDHFSGKYYYHLECFSLRPKFKELDPEQHIHNLEQLNKKDRKQVLELIKNELDRLREGRKKVKAEPTKSKKTEPVQQEQAKKDNRKSKSKGKSKSKSKGKSKSVGKSKSEGKSKSKQTKKDKSEGKSSVSLTDDGLKGRRNTRSKSKPKAAKSKPKQQALPTKPKNKKRAKKTQPDNVSSGYTPAQLAEFKQLVDQYMGYGVEKLKAILAANNQSRVGNKKELSQKCADGKILGKMPMCASCGGGKLRFNRLTGIYHCPGYMDDDEFKNCHKNYTMAEIVREPWVEP